MPKDDILQENQSFIYDAESEREANILGQCIAQARIQAGLAYSDLADELTKLGVKATYTAVTKWERGDTQPSAYQLIALSKVLDLGVELDQLTSHPELNEEGLDMVRIYRTGLIKSGKYKPSIVPKQRLRQRQRVKKVTMLVSNMRVSAGHGEYLDRESFEPLSVPASSVPDNADFGIWVSGDSMEPVYHDNQLVWIHKCNKLEPGDVGVFIYDGNGYLKELSRCIPDEQEDFIDSDGSVHYQTMLLSFNPKYDPIKINDELGFYVVGRVCK